MKISLSPHFNNKKNFLNYNYPYKIRVKMLEEIFSDNFDVGLKSFIRKSNLKYRFLKKHEIEDHQIEIDKVLTSNLTPSGPKRKKIWDLGWQDIMKSFKNH